MLQAKDIQFKSGEEVVTDVVIFEQGEYRNPLKIITDNEAIQLAINLGNCVDKCGIQMIIDNLTRTLQKGE